NKCQGSFKRTVISLKTLFLISSIDGVADFLNTVEQLTGFQRFDKLTVKQTIKLCVSAPLRFLFKQLDDLTNQQLPQHPISAHFLLHLQLEFFNLK
ncbi:MAG: hypothetical protein MI866_21890, partial [Bacteroidales bacterium]|nr:hypothetical protein [Bacteroidales bacterium]